MLRLFRSNPVHRIGFEHGKLVMVVIDKFGKNLNFNQQQCQWIEKHYKRYMDDGFAALLKSIEITVFLKCLNLLHLMIHFTGEKATTTTIDGQETQILNFLDVNVILKERSSTKLINILIKTTIFLNFFDMFRFIKNHLQE